MMLCVAHVIDLCPMANAMWGNIPIGNNFPPTKSGMLVVGHLVPNDAYPTPAMVQTPNALW